MIAFLNAINLLTVFVGFLVQILIVRFFGASDSTDIYYLAITVVTFVTGLSTGFLTDLFVPIYQDAKSRRFEDAQKLSGSVMTLALGTGLLCAAATYVLSSVIISVFASGFPADKAGTASTMLRIIAFSIPFATISMVLNSTLNANSFLMVTYVTNLIAPICNALGIALGGLQYGVSALMYATVFASALTFAILYIYCKLKVGARFSNPFRHQDISYLLMKNVPVRMTNFLNLLKGPLTTTALSYFPAGVLTLYSYAERIITVLLGTANSPLTQFYYVRSSELASRKNFDEIRRLFNVVVKNGVLLFAGLFFVTVIAFQEVFTLLLGDKVSSDGIRTMFVIALALFPFSYVSLLTAQIGATSLAMKKGRLTMYAAGVFVGVLGITIIPMMNSFSIFGLPVSLCLAQIASLAVSIRLLNNIEPIVHSELFRAQADTLVFSTALIAFNTIWSPAVAVRIAVNVILFLGWLGRNWNEAIETLKFVTAKGEVR